MLKSAWVVGCVDAQNRGQKVFNRRALHLSRSDLTF